MQQFEIMNGSFLIWSELLDTFLGKTTKVSLCKNNGFVVVDPTIINSNANHERSIGHNPLTCVQGLMQHRQF